MSRILKPIHINDCPCGGRHVNWTTNGLTETYYCDECDELIAELVVGAEP